MPQFPSRTRLLLAFSCPVLAVFLAWQIALWLNPPGPEESSNACAEEPARASKTADGKEEKPAKKKHANRLAKETSPYLLLHAHNPVDWYPWGPEALEKAKKEGKLIFLSIGYSSCYWCHVMERESFMDEEIAKFLNEHFVCIKVDREERPDIDEIYMAALHVYYEATGHPGRGGWPLSMFLTPEAKPVGGFTYLPPRADKKRGTSAGFVDVIKSVQKIWTDKAKSVSEQGENLARMVQRQLQQRPALSVVPPEARDLVALQTALAEDFDSRYGGFGYSESNPRQPKFPEPSNLVFLLHRARHAPNETAREEAKRMLLKTLDAMAAGGIWDHVGGGFHRYSTDRYWKIPHFEKMLYDNGQLASVYVEAFALTDRKEYRAVTEGILEFVLREMTGPQGAFYAALDAETEAEEGRFYVWETAELKRHLSDEQFRLFAVAYGVGDEPNFEGRHTLLLPRPLAETAATEKLSAEELEAKLVPLRKTLLEVRNRRARPLTDTKVLTSWNGLMIRGFADAGRVLKNDRYLKAAAAAADFVLKELRGRDGRLLRTYSGERAKLNAYLDDYAFLANGLIALHQATSEVRWLEAARQITDKQIELFWDERDGGYFFTSKDHEDLIARSKGGADGALPAGNSVAAENLIYLGRQLKDSKYLDRAEKTIAARASLLKEHPKAFPRMYAVLAALRAEREKP